MKICHGIIGLSLFMAFGAFEVQAEWIKAVGQYSFGPEISEELACRRAERRAKDNALKQRQGERLSSDDLLICKEQNAKANCDLNRFTWSSINGLISGLRHLERKTSVLSGAYRTCTVTLEANVDIAKGKSDPTFDLSVHLNEKTFKEGDLLEIMIEPTKDMYVTIFQWLPYEISNKQVMRIFPNVMDRDNHFVTKGPVPTVQGRKNYDMALAFPDTVSEEERLVDEYLLVVATRHHIQFREAYNLEEFNKRLLEIPRSDSRIIKRAYVIVKNGDRK